MNLKKNLLRLLLLIALPGGAQHWQSFNTYHYDLMQINVAGIGQNHFNANLNYRAAMIEMEGGPRLYQVDGALAFGKQAIGAKIYQQSVGLLENKMITGAYVYKLKTGEKKWLYMGIGVSFMQNIFNAQKAMVWDIDDVNLQGADDQISNNNFDSEAGLVWYGEKLTAGLSVNHLYNTNFGNAIINQKQQFNLHASYNLSLGSSFTITPMLMNRYILGDPYKIPEFLVTTTYKNSLALGVGYRNPGAMIFNLAGLFNRLKVVYSFDYNLDKTLKLFGTSHQLMLGYSIAEKKK